MQRLAFARHARKVLSFSNPPPPPHFSYLSNTPPIPPIPPTPPIPRFSYLSNTPRRFFSQITEQNGVVPMDEFHKVLSCLLQNNNAADGSTLESSLNSLHLTTLDQHFLLKIIETPNVSPNNLITFIYWAWNNNNNNITSPVLESLVSAICSVSDPALNLWKNDIYFLWDLVKDIGHNQSGLLNVRLLNQLIISFSTLQQGNAALEAFHKFELFQCVPNHDTYYFTIKSILCSIGSVDRAAAWSVCQKMLLDDPESMPDGEKVGHILSWFCSEEMGKEAYALFLAAKLKRKQVHMFLLDNLVDKLCNEKETVQLALEMLNHFDEVEVDEKEWGKMEEKKERKKWMFRRVVHALCRFKDVDAAKQLILRMIADGLPPNNVTFEFIITAYTKAGEMGQALEMVKLLESIGLKLNFITYEVLFSGYLNAMDEARKILEEVKNKGSRISPVIYDTLIIGYCKLQLFDEALKSRTVMLPPKLMEMRN